MMEKSRGRLPQDRRRYRKDPRSEPVHSGLGDGCYVHVRDLDGTVYVLPDGQHAHVRVLGDAKPELYAGDLTIRGIVVVDLTNCSGTFRFRMPTGCWMLPRVWSPQV